MDSILIRKDDLFPDVRLELPNICEGLSDAPDNLSGPYISKYCSKLSEMGTCLVDILSAESLVQEVTQGVLHDRGGDRKRNDRAK